MKNLSRHLSYANVVSTLALVAAVGGGTSAIAVKKKAPKGAVVRVTKKSDITKNGKIRPQRVTKENIAAGAVGANQLGTLLRKARSGSGGLYCDGGSRVISGGFHTLGAGPIASSLPIAEGWTAGPANFVYATCLLP